MASSHHHNTAAASHVAIDMQPLNRSQQSAPAAAPALGTEHIAIPVVAGQSDRSRSRSRSRSSGRKSSPRSETPANRPNKIERLVNNDFDPLLPNGTEDDAEMIPNKRPTIVVPESLDDDDDPRIPNTPQEHPGVDDGFITSSDQPSDDGIDADDRPDGPKIDLTPRMGGDSDDGRRSNRGNGGSFPTPRRPSFPPSFVPGPDGTVIIPDVNVYQQKKTLAQGMMDLALLSANANQLRYVLESNRSHPYFYVSLTFISISIILQVAVGVGLIWNSRYNVKDDADICKADRINNFTVIGIFLITTVNVFITSFGVAAIDQTVNRV